MEKIKNIITYDKSSAMLIAIKAICTMLFVLFLPSKSENLLMFYINIMLILLFILMLISDIKSYKKKYTNSDSKETIFEKSLSYSILIVCIITVSLLSLSLVYRV